MKYAALLFLLLFWPLANTARADSDTLTVASFNVRFLDDNRDICYALLSDNGDINFLLKMRAIISRRAFSNLPKKYSRFHNKNDYIYIISYLESGTVGLLRYWLSDESENRKTPEELGALLDGLFMNGLDGMKD